MVTKESPSPSSSGDESPPQMAEEKGFFGQLVQSVFEPGANHAAVLAMNVSFFLLILTLFALAFLTSWNKHVMILLSVTTLLWATMVWFVMEITKVQSRPDNMPIIDQTMADSDSKRNQEKSRAHEAKKDR